MKLSHKYRKHAVLYFTGLFMGIFYGLEGFHYDLYSNYADLGGEK